MSDLLMLAVVAGLAVFGIRECCIAEDAAFRRCAAACGGVDMVAYSLANPNPGCRCRGVGVYP